MRKIIQISVVGVENTAQTQCNYVTVALCDDGSIWEMRDTKGSWEFVCDGLIEAKP